MSFWDGLTSAMDDIRTKVVEEPYFGREVTENIELPQAAETSKWDALSQEKGIIEPEQSEPSVETELER